MRVLEVQPVDIKVKIVEASNLEYESTVDDDQSRVHLAYGHIRQALPFILVDVEAVAVVLSYRHRPHAHIHHHLTCPRGHHDFLAAQDGPVSELWPWDILFLGCK